MCELRGASGGASSSVLVCDLASARVRRAGAGVRSLFLAISLSLFYFPGAELI